MLPASKNLYKSSVSAEECSSELSLPFFDQITGMWRTLPTAVEQAHPADRPSSKGQRQGWAVADFPSWAASCNAAIRAASFSPRSPTASSTNARSSASPSAGGRCSCCRSCPPSWCCSSTRACPSSPAFDVAQHRAKPNLRRTVQDNWGFVIYMAILMMCFNLFSHGTQDLYLIFLQKQHEFSSGMVSFITVIANLGAIAGGLTLGHFSERIGWANTITLAAVIALPALPLWAYADHAGAAGARCLRHAESRGRAPGAWFPPISTNFRLPRRARPFRPSPIRSAISSPPTTGRSRRGSPRRTAETTPSRWWREWSRWR